MKQNTKVYLPKALGVEEESALEMLRQEWMGVYKQHEEQMKKEFGRFAQMESNLTNPEKDGLQTLKKKVNEGELVVLRTDKSGRFTVKDRARETMLNDIESFSPLYTLYKDHKGWHWAIGGDPPGRP